MNKNICCFFGHRKIDVKNEVRETLYNVIKKLIVEERVDTFLFGSKSQFNNLCYQVVSKLKEEYSYIKRVYVRAEFPYINDDYLSYLLENYEETYYPDNMLRAGKASYVERNCEMINKSSFCVVYFDEKYAPPKRKKRSAAFSDYQPKSGTKIAYDYALKNKKIIINVFETILKTPQ